jgi:light-regulated signal transduction histidine kinase (bacteriophytochrome)
MTNSSEINSKSERALEEISPTAIETEEKVDLINTQKALLNILEDYNADKANMENIQRAKLNILEDYADEKQKVEKANAALLSANKELEQFAYIASHDLQEPLRTISNFSTLLAQREKEHPDKESAEYINFIAKGAERMSQLIFDLLEYSRIGKDANTLPMDCNKLVNEVLTDLSASIKESNAEIQTGKLPTVNGFISLKSVFQNLIGNAIKYRKEGVHPIVSISASDKGKEFLFSIKDNGIGIEKAFHERIFLIFQRLHTRAEYAGTGIGLAYCRKTVELHGGKIWVESDPGKGCTFNFTLSKTINNL